MKNNQVLIAEDETLVARMIEGMLRELGYEVVGRAADGVQAIEMIKKYRPDVVLMDYKLPEINGVEVTRRVHRICPTPIVMLTAYDKQEMVDEATAAGAGYYLVKPPSKGEIQRGINITMARFADLMKMRRLNEELQVQITEKEKTQRKLRKTQIHLEQVIKDYKRTQDLLHERIVALTRPITDVGKFELSDIISLKTLQNLQDAFYECFNIPSIICKPNGKPITHTGGFSDFCDIVRSSSEGAKTCQALHKKIVAKAFMEGPSIQRCCAVQEHIRGVVPIRILSRHVADWIIFHIVDGVIDLQKIREYAHRIGVDEEALLEATQHFTRMPQKKITDALKFLDVLVHQITVLGLQNLMQARNVHLRKQAEETLKQERKLFIDGPVVVFKWKADERWIVQEVSPNVAQFGYTQEKFKQQDISFLDLVHPEDRERIVEEACKHAEEGRLSMDLSYRICSPDGETYWVHDFTMIHRDAEQRISHYHGYLLDISRQKNAERQLTDTSVNLEHAQRKLREKERQIVHQERLVSLGQMAVGVAHRINNALQPIYLSASLLKTKHDLIEDRQRLGEQAQFILEASQNITDLVQSMVRLYKPGIGTENTTVDLNKLIHETIQFLHPKWKAEAQARGVSINILTDLHHPCLVTGVENDFREVLINLMLNAIEAICQDQGVIIIGAQCIGGIINMKIKDNGEGMSESVRDKCLEPLFSTKADTGSGVGLSVVQGIVRSYGGEMEIESAEKVGSKITIHIPAALCSEQERGIRDCASLYPSFYS